MSDNSVVKYDEKGVLDGGTVGLPREMNRDIWLKEVFPEWGSFLKPCSQWTGKSHHWATSQLTAVKNDG